jgi:hypothetical protein
MLASNGDKIPPCGVPVAVSWLAWASVKMPVVLTATTTVNDVLDGHVGLGLECMDRIYLNG